MYGNKFGAIATHPGEVLKDEIEYRKISQRKLATQMQISYTALNEILNAKRAVTTTTAYLFEAAMDIPAEMLLKLQMRYDMQKAQSDTKLKARIDAIRKIVAVL